MIGQTSKQTNKQTNRDYNFIYRFVKTYKISKIYHTERKYLKINDITLSYFSQQYPKIFHGIIMCNYFFSNQYKLFVYKEYVRLLENLQTFRLLI